MTPSLSFLSRWTLMSLCLSLAACGSLFGAKSSRPSTPASTALSADATRSPAGAEAVLEIDAAWWRLFHDPVLDGLQTQLYQGHLNLHRMAANVRQAQASLAAAQSSLWPSVSLNASASKAQEKAGSPAHVLSVAAPVSWEWDVWGRVAALNAAAQANLVASQEDLALVRLSAQATLVQTYVALRTAERQGQVLAQAEQAYARALSLTRYRYEAGVVSAADVAQAEVQLATAQAQRIDVHTTRRQLQHAVAVLLGVAPAEFTLAEGTWPQLPVLPDTLSADVLQRRPDIRAASQRVLAAQAQVGVAQAAFFPSVGFSANVGYRSSELSNLFSASSLLWSLGPSMAMNLIDGGQRDAVKAEAKAALDGAGIAYRQVVLQALQELEDNLMAAQQLQLQAAAQSQAVQSARRNLDITQAQYIAGTVSFLNVVSAQASALTAERSLLEIQSRQRLASAQILKNLAGRWPTDQALN
jgi:NodT family efflux transporter outer membrane factor (OMF) lipoprotein